MNTLLVPNAVEMLFAAQITQRIKLQYHVRLLRGYQWLSDPLIGPSPTRLHNLKVSEDTLLP